MRNIFACFVSILLCASVLPACGSVRFNEQANATNAATQDAAQAASENQELDCDAYMQSFADACFEITVKDENGALRNDVDADGNDLGPVDQGWAADYCTCFAQRAFQEFGCASVYADEELNDEAWQAKYNAIGDVCAEAVQNMGQDATDATDAVDSVDAAAPVADQSVDAAADVQVAPATN